MDLVRFRGEWRAREADPPVVGENGWPLVNPRLVAMRPDAAPRGHDPRALDNALRWSVRGGTAANPAGRVPAVAVRLPGGGPVD